MTKKITIHHVIQKANEAGYKTYLKGIDKPTIPYMDGTMPETKYILDGDSWETAWLLPESELEAEYNIFCKILADRKKTNV